MKRFDGFMHGVNLGGWLSQCDYSEDRLNNFIKEEDIKTIAGWGLDHVRLPVDFNIFENNDGSRKEDGYVRVANAIEWCKKYNLNMILDVHKTAGFSFDAGEKETGFFDNEKYQNRVYNLWENLAKAFATAFDGTKNEICFELLNEVTDQAFSKKWNAIANTCIKRIRAIAPTTKILIGSYWNNSLASVKDLDMPYDSNIVYNFHCYEPLVFTHQGAYWIEKMPHDFRMPFKTKFSDYAKWTEEKCGQIGVSFNGFDPNGTPDENYFDKLFKEATDIAEARGVLLYCGEYGVIELADKKDAMEWYKAISTIFNKYGIGRAAWSYKEMDFGLSDKRLDDVRDEFMKYL